jgi:hypothetical protein
LPAPERVSRHDVEMATRREMMDVWCGLYQLAPGKDLDEYIAWNDIAAKEVRQLIPTIRQNWQMYVIEETSGPGAAPVWTLLETIELEDWRQWLPAWQGHPRLTEIWDEFVSWIDVESLRVVNGRKVYGRNF